MIKYLSVPARGSGDASQSSPTAGPREPLNTGRQDADNATDGRRMSR